MAERGTFTPWHPIARKYVRRIERHRYGQNFGSSSRDCMRRSRAEIPANEEGHSAAHRGTNAPARTTSAAGTSSAVAGLQGGMKRSGAVTLKL